MAPSDDEIVVLTCHCACPGTLWGENEETTPLYQSDVDAGQTCVHACQRIGRRCVFTGYTEQGSGVGNDYNQQKYKMDDPSGYIICISWEATPLHMCFSHCNGKYKEYDAGGTYWIPPPRPGILVSIFTCEEFINAIKCPPRNLPEQEFPCPWGDQCSPLHPPMA